MDGVAWEFSGKNTGVGCHFFLQRIFPTQGSNPGFPHCRQRLYHLSHQGSQGSLPPVSTLLILYLQKLRCHLLREVFLDHTLLNCNLIVKFSSVAQSYPTLCDPMNSSTPGLPVHHHLPEFTQTHVHRVGDAIQPSHPLSSPSPPAPSPSHHQRLFQ